MKIQPSARLSCVSEYYFSKKLKEIDKMIQEGIKVINLGVGNPDMAPSKAVIEKLTESAQSPMNHGYQSYYGIKSLRIEFSYWYKKYFNCTLNPDSEILPLIGSKEGIMHISMAFLDAGDKVLIPDPGYPTYAAAARLAGAEVIYYKLSEKNNWNPDFNELENLDLSHIKIMWVNYPNMPTGANATSGLFKQFLDFGLKHNILIINDNAYGLITNEKPVSILSFDNAKEISMELNSLSKSHNMAGWRVGVIAGDSAYIQHIAKFKTNMDSGMFLPVQLAAVEALKSPDVWYKELNSIYNERRKIAEIILKNLGCSFRNNQSGMFLWASVSQTFKNGREMSDYLLQKHHVFVTPGDVFGVNGEKYIRMSLSVSNELLLAALNRIHYNNKKEIPKVLWEKV